MSNTLLQEARAALPDGSPGVSDDLAMKQLVHSQVLLAMDDSGLLDTATFQGGEYAPYSFVEAEERLKNAVLTM